MNGSKRLLLLLLLSSTVCTSSTQMITHKHTLFGYFYPLAFASIRFRLLFPKFIRSTLRFMTPRSNFNFEQSSESVSAKRDGPQEDRGAEMERRTGGKLHCFCTAVLAEIATMATRYCIRHTLVHGGEEPVHTQARPHARTHTHADRRSVQRGTVSVLPWWPPRRRRHQYHRRFRFSVVVVLVGIN